MKKYVLGFAFDTLLEAVVLIKKNRPEWQAGKLNGVGGKVEDGESFIDAMTREFREECGMETDSDHWVNFLTMKSNSFIVEVYKIMINDPWSVESKTDEKVVVSYVDELFLDNIHTQTEMISNIPWIISMALDKDSDRFKSVVEYKE